MLEAVEEIVLVPVQVILVPAIRYEQGEMKNDCQFVVEADSGILYPETSEGLKVIAVLDVEIVKFNPFAVVVANVKVVVAKLFMEVVENDPPPPPPEIPNEDVDTHVELLPFVWRTYPLEGVVPIC